MTPRARTQLSAGILVVIAVMVSTGPFATDMYLPTLPQLGRDLAATDSAVQATISTFMIGMALGQLFGGPLSDSHGRYPYLIGGSVVAVVGSVLAALTPTITVLLVARLVMGFGAGVAMVAARSMIPDLTRGSELARAFSALMAIQAIAPVIAPVLGGVLTEPIGWRGIMWTLAGISILQLILGALTLGETLPKEKRSAGGLAAFGSNIATVLRSRSFVGYTLALGFFSAAFFSYLAGSAFVFQTQLGFTVGQYTTIFVAYSLVMALGSVLNARLVRSYAEGSIAVTVLVIALVGAVALLLAGVVGDPPAVWWVVAALLLAIGGNSMLLANINALGTRAAGRYAGTGQALLGALPFALGGLVSPLVGLGENQVLFLGLVMTVAMVLALAAFFYARKHD